MSSGRNRVWTRRRFLHHTSAALASALVSTNTFGISSRGRSGVPCTRPTHSNPDLPALAARALDAARSAGAEYADVRLSHTRTQSPALSEEEVHGVGVRVLVDGVWGFLASAVWTPDEVTRLARDAVSQAKASYRKTSTHGPLLRTLAPVSQIASGEWVMPVKYDPFEIPIDEKLDVMNAFADFAKSYTAGITVDHGMTFVRESQVGATSDGASWRQTKYWSVADFRVGCREEPHRQLPQGGAVADFLSPAGRGWEYVSESGLLDRIPGLIDFAEQSRYRKPVEVGRYDIVFSAPAVAALLDQTLGAATELDRALGYEANAGGTSYLQDPLTMLGRQRVGSPLVTVTANRSLPGGAATTQWDDEGVAPEEFTLVKDGVLVDYQTTRESALWLAPYYQRLGKVIRSHGCMSAESALDIPLPQSPNLQLLPGKDDHAFEDLVAGTEKGIAVYTMRITIDQQQLNGIATGVMREINHGKLGKFLDGAAIAFRAPEFWNNLVALGGPASVQWTGLSRPKGEPAQATVHSVGAPVGKVAQVSVIDVMRKA